MKVTANKVAGYEATVCIKCHGKVNGKYAERRIKFTQKKKTVETKKCTGITKKLSGAVEDPKQIPYKQNGEGVTINAFTGWFK